MKKKLSSLFNFDLVAIILILFLLFNTTSLFAQQVTLVNDNFDRAALTGGPVTYTPTITATGVISTTFSAALDYRLQIKNAPNPTAAIAGIGMVMGSMSTVSGYNSILNSNTDLITWSFSMKQGKTTSPNNMTGWAIGKWGIATVIACNVADPTSATANGYAVVMGGSNTQTTYDLVSFVGGLNNNINLTSMIIGITPATSWKNIVSIKVTYNKATQKWDMYQKDEGSASAGTAYPDPSGISVAPIGEVLDTAGFVTSSLPYFGFVFNYNTTTNNSVYFDNFKVSKGTQPVSKFYLAINSDCSNLNNWWANQNGTGAHPTNFTNDFQEFNIYNTGATINSDWTVSGSASKVILGNGTVSNSLIITPTAALNGKIDLAALSNLTINHLTLFPNLQTLNPTSTVNYSGLDGQTIQGVTYGNLNIASQGLLSANASGAITVIGNLDIANGSTLFMGSNKLSSVGTLSGSGAINTKNEFSSSLPAGLTWPFDVYFNYTSANNPQTIPFGFYKNLDLTGGPRKLINDISISGTYNPGNDPLSIITNEINFDGTSPQIVPVSTYNNLTVSNLSGATATGTLLVAGTVSGNDFFDVSNATIIMNGSTNQFINLDSFKDDKLANLTINNATEVALLTDLNLIGTLTLQTGILNTSTNVFKLVSNASGTANVAGVDGVINSGSITGSVKVERYLNNQRGWNLVGNPTTNAISMSNLASLSSTPFDITYGVNNQSSKTYTSDTWAGISSNATTMPFNTGIALFNRGIAGEGFQGSYTSGPSNVTLAVSGSLNLAQQTTLTTENNYYLVANPFAAPISLSVVLQSSTGLSGTVAYYDPSANSPANLQTMAGGYMIANPSGIPGDVNDVVIPSMGAFLVRANTAGSIVIPVSAIYNGPVLPNTSSVVGSFAALPGMDPDSQFLSNLVFESNKVKCFPNPVDNVLNILNNSSVSEVVIYNLMGQIVYKSIPNSSNLQVDMSNFNASTYFVQITSEGKRETFKVVKK